MRYWKFRIYVYLLPLLSYRENPGRWGEGGGAQDLPPRSGKRIKYLTSTKRLKLRIILHVYEVVRFRFCPPTQFGTIVGSHPLQSVIADGWLGLRLIRAADLRPVLVLLVYR